jgi:hypothetical protein
MFGIVGGVTEEVAISTEVPLERLEAQICEGAAHLAAGIGRWLLYPRIGEALCSGELSYSKVRAITRVVTAETEATLIDLASAVSTPTRVPPFLPP